MEPIDRGPNDDNDNDEESKGKKFEGDIDDLYNPED